MLLLLCAGVGMGGGTAAVVVTAPIITDTINFVYTQTDAVNFAYTQTDALDFAYTQTDAVNFVD